MGSLQDELMRTKLAKASNYANEMKLQDIHPDIRPLVRRMSEMKEKFPLLTESEKAWFIPLRFGITVDEKKEALQHICAALEKY